MLALLLIFSTQTSIKTFLQITDAHVDCSQNGECDLSVVKSAFDYIGSHYSPEFIAWTGDSLSYNACSIFPPQKQTQISQITTLLGEYFPDTTVIPVFGNHDACPSNILPIDDSEFYGDFLTPGKWGKFVDSQSERATFLKGGYYSKRLSSSLMALCLNSILWISPNHLAVNQTDPAGQFNWLYSALKQAREIGDKVMIFSHVPPGHEPNMTRLYNLERFNSHFVELLGEFNSQIVGVFCGHIHHSVVFVDPTKFNRAIYASPALSRVAGSPGVRIYSYDENMNEIVDYIQMYLSNDGFWEGYKQSSLFCVEGNNARMVYSAVIGKFVKYVELFTYGSNKTCNVRCKLSLLCSMKLLLNEYNTCYLTGLNLLNLDDKN